MRMNRSSAALWKSMVRMAAAIWMTLLIFSSAGCGKRVDYVNGDHKLTRLKQGDPAPRPGVLISESYLAEIFDALGRPNPAADPANSKPAPAAPAFSPAFTIQKK